MSKRYVPWKLTCDECGRKASWLIADTDSDDREAADDGWYCKSCADRVAVFYEREHEPERKLVL